MKRTMFFLLVLGFVLLPLAVQAQVQPTSGVISFKGTIPGQPDGPVDLRFRLFPVDVGGAFCFEETQLGVQVTTEAFSVFIGDGTTGGIPPSPCFTDNPSLWIAFGVDADPDTEIGARASITSSGFAHFALGVTDNAVTTAKIQDDAVTSAKIAAGSVDSSKIVDGSIGASHVDSTQVQRRVIGSCDAGNAIRVINDAGTVTCEPTGGGGGIGGSGTADSIPKFTAATTIGDSAITEVSGNVGIGTTSPDALLQVRNPANQGGIVHIGGGIQTGVEKRIRFGDGDFVAIGEWSGQDDTMEIKGTRIFMNGNVGIGTSEPVSRLHVQNGASGIIVPTTDAIRGECSVFLCDGVVGFSARGVGVRGRTNDTSFPGVRAESAGSSSANLGLSVVGRAEIFGNVGVRAFPSNGVTLPNIADVNGRGLANRWDTYSSRRWKTNIQTIQGALEKVARLRGVSFDWKENGGHDIGLIAEEVGEVVPEVVGYEENGKDARSLDYARLTALLIEAVKEQQSQIRELKAEVEGLKAKQTGRGKMAMSASLPDGEASPAAAP